MEDMDPGAQAPGAGPKTRLAADARVTAQIRAYFRDCNEDSRTVIAGEAPGLMRFGRSTPGCATSSFRSARSLVPRPHIPYVCLPVLLVWIDCGACRTSLHRNGGGSRYRDRYGGWSHGAIRAGGGDFGYRAVRQHCG